MKEKFKDTGLKNVIEEAKESTHTLPHTFSAPFFSRSPTTTINDNNPLLILPQSGNKNSGV